MFGQTRGKPQTPSSGIRTMPTWKNELPKNPTSRGFSIKRPPTQGTIRSILTADRLLVCDTHYWHGRTVPGERVLSDTGSTLDDSLCLPCRDKQGWRTHVYISAFEAKSRDHFIYECTDAAAKPLEEYYQANGTLRGCIINAYRPKGTPKGKVLLLTAAAALPQINLPNPPDVIAALCVIWRIPRVGMDKQLAYAGRDNFE